MPRFGKALGNRPAQAFVGVDTHTFAPKIRHCAFVRPAAAGGFDVAVIGGEVDAEAVREQQIQKRREVAERCPLAHLVVHAGGAELHAVHDAIHFVHHQADDAHVGRIDECGNVVKGPVAQALQIPNLVYVLVAPESPPQRFLLVGVVDAPREQKRRGSGEDGLARDRCDGGNPCEHGLLAEPPAGTLPAEFPPHDGPLIECQPVHHDQCGFLGRILRGIADLPCQKAGNVVQHHRRCGRQIGEPAVAAAKPIGERRVHARSQSVDLVLVACVWSMAGLVR